VPCWLASRNAADLPADFLSLTTEAAIARIRGADAVMDAGTPTNSSSDTVQASENIGRAHDGHNRPRIPLAIKAWTARSLPSPIWRPSWGVSST